MRCIQTNCSEQGNDCFGSYPFLRLSYKTKEVIICASCAIAKFICRYLVDVYGATLHVGKQIEQQKNTAIPKLFKMSSNASLKSLANKGKATNGTAVTTNFMLF